MQNAMSPGQFKTMNAVSVAANDLIDWIADRDGLLIAAWTPQVMAALNWEAPFAEALAGELHAAMLTTMLRGGSESNFFDLVTHINIGFGAGVERLLAERFFRVSLKLARAAARAQRDQQARAVLPFKYGIVVGDARTDPTHLPLSKVILPWDHSFWMRWQPPLGMDCRCATNNMTHSQMKRSGRTLTTDAELSLIESQLRDSWLTEFLMLLDFRRREGPL